MSLGTLDRSPPAFFRQGPSALTQLLVLGAIAIFLMVADARFGFAAPLRSGIATVLLPLQQALLVPVRWLAGGSDYIGGLQAAVDGERQARRQLADQALQAARAQALMVENERLRALLDLRPALPPRALAAEALHELKDPFSRRLMINRGAQSGVELGAPVLVPEGVLGQVTRVFPLSAEVALLTDREAAIPVLVRRSMVRGIATGGARLPEGDAMELRFVSANADIEVGDLLETSGLDGLYPSGLPVAQVAQVERRVESGFARVLLQPATAQAARRHLLVVLSPQRSASAPGAARPGSAPAPAGGARP